MIMAIANEPVTLMNRVENGRFSLSHRTTARLIPWRTAPPIPAPTKTIKKGTIICLQRAQSFMCFLGGESVSTKLLPTLKRPVGVISLSGSCRGTLSRQVAHYNNQEQISQFEPMPRLPTESPRTSTFAAQELLDAPEADRPAKLENMAKALTGRLLKDEPGIGANRACSPSSCNASLLHHTRPSSRYRSSRRALLARRSRSR